MSVKLSAYDVICGRDTVFIDCGQFITLGKHSSERINRYSAMNWKGFGSEGPWHNLMCHLGDDLE
jgi:hypothetical protein